MRQLSGGMKRRVRLIQALLSDPELRLDLAATCSRLAVMKKGRILYIRDMRKMLERLKYSADVSSKQYTDRRIQLRIIIEEKPHIRRTCMLCEVTLKDAYIWVSNRDVDIF